MGKKKIVLDTNILISALGWKGNPKEIFTRVIEKEFELVLSRKQLEEIKEVLNYPKFTFTEDQKTKFLSILLEIATIVETQDSIDVIKEDPDDNMILETALENDVEYIVTGDDHLLKLKNFGTIKIITAAEFIALIKDKKL